LLFSILVWEMHALFVLQKSYENTILIKKNNNLQIKKKKKKNKLKKKKKKNLQILNLETKKKKIFLRIFKFCKGYDMYSIVSIQDLL